MEDPSEHRGDPAARPPDRVLDLREGAWPVGCGGERREQLAHEVAAPILEAGDLAGIVHGVVRRVLAQRPGLVTIR
jgi:hypothetical protein